MYTGKIYLDYEDNDEEQHYICDVSRCLLRDNELVLEFSGSDEGSLFHGHCTLARLKSECKGEGVFNYDGEQAEGAEVSLTLYIDGSNLSLEGTWTDHNDAKSPYRLEADLEEVK